MQLRVLCTKDQLDDLNSLMHEAAISKEALFLVSHTTHDPEDSDIEDALEFASEIDWGKLPE